MNEPRSGTTRAEDPKHHSVTAALQKPWQLFVLL